LQGYFSLLYSTHQPEPEPRSLFKRLSTLSTLSTLSNQIFQIFPSITNEINDDNAPPTHPSVYIHRLRMRSGALTREEEERLLATGLAGLSGKGTNGSMTDQEIRNAADELQSLLASAQGGARGAIDPRVEELSRHDPKFTATAGSDANLRWRAKP
jgi:hypothetical protein